VPNPSRPSVRRYAEGKGESGTPLQATGEATPSSAHIFRHNSVRGFLSLGSTLRAGVRGMESDLSRAQRYRVRAAEMQSAATQESDERRRADLVELAAMYERLADSLIGKHTP